MNPFRKRSKSTSAGDKKSRKGLSGAPQIISTADLAFSLPSENAFRTSLLMPKMADRFSLLRLDEPGQNYKSGEKSGQSPGDEYANPHFGMHTRDLSILEEGDEEDEELPVHPWDRRGAPDRDHAFLRDGMSKDEFMRVRAQQGNSLFSGKQRTFKFKSEDGNDTDRQYSSSSMSSKSPHSPAFEYRPQSSHTSATSSILFSTAKPPQVNSKAAKTLGFDFGLPETQSPQIPPSPTSTVYEMMDSPTVPDFLLAEDEAPTVDLVRNHLRRPSTAHTQAPAPNYHEAQYPSLRRLDNPDNSRAKKTETVFQVDDAERDSLWDDNSSVFAYYGELLSGDGVDEVERVIMGEEWVQTRQQGQQIKAAQMTGYPYPISPKSPKFRGARDPRGSLFDNLPPAHAPLNVKTHVTILQSPTASSSPNDTLKPRESNDSIRLSLIPYNTAHPIQYQSGGALGAGYEASIVHEVPKESSTPKKRSRQESNRNSPPSQSRSNSREPAALNTDPRHITPELHPTAVFPNTPPLSVSPNQKGPTKQTQVPQPPDQSFTPPPSNTERRRPTENVMKALKERIISEPQLISMTATVPTVPIIRMKDEKVEQLRNENRKTRSNSNRVPPDRKPRRAMLDDEVDDVKSPLPGAYTRRKGNSPPAVATRRQTRRRETTAGSVLFDEQMRDRAQSPSSSKLLAGPEYSIRLPSPHLINDSPYQPVVQNHTRHRRKVSRQDIDPVTTHSSPAILNQWDGHPKRRMVGAIDPAW